MRQEKAKPIWDELRAWLDKNLGAAPPQTYTGKAINHLAADWPRLIRYLVMRNACLRQDGMIIPPTGIRVLVATKPVDFRKGMDGLAAYLAEQLEADPYSGVIYVFRAKRADRVKLLFWDGTGVCLLMKRLEGGTFRWPRVEDGVMRLSPAQLSALLEGLDWRRVHAACVARPTATQ